MLDFFPMPRLQRVILVIVLLCALPPAGVSAQDQGVAVITSPLDGAIVSGVVPISGAATHPQFQRYELAFGYSPNPTDTWFSLQDPAVTQVVNDVLGRWDTTGVTDGLYVLRLRVYWTDRNYLEAFVRNVQVQNATPTPTVPPPEATTSSSPLPALTLTAPVAGTAATQPLIILPPPSTPRPTTNAAIAIGSGTGMSAARLNTQVIRGAFFDGVRFTVVLFALLGAYAGLRAAWRSRSRR